MCKAFRPECLGYNPAFTFIATYVLGFLNDKDNNDTHFIGTIWKQIS